MLVRCPLTSGNVEPDANGRSDRLDPCTILQGAFWPTSAIRGRPNHSPNDLADRIKPDHDWLTETSLVDEINDIAERIAVNREVAGVHYKSDTEAGVTLAAGIWRLIGSNDNFAQMIEAARAEWRPDRAIQSGYSFLRRSLERTA